MQEICDRTALATGRGLGELAVQRFGRVGRLVLDGLIFALIVANSLSIAADLVAIGSGMELLHAGHTWLWALISGTLITALLVLGSFARIALVFKVLCAALLAYLVVAVMVTSDWRDVAHHAIAPQLHLESGYVALLVAVLGTTISPYLFFWQSAHRLEEMRDEPEGGNEALPLRFQGRRRASQATDESRGRLHWHGVFARGHVRHHPGDR